MIEHEDQYFTFIKAQGVGVNDKVKDASPKSYLSYLRSTATVLVINISPKTVKTDNDVANILLKLKETRTRSPHTISNYGTALKKYAEMVQKLNL